MWCIWMYLHPLPCPCWFYDFIWPTELIVSQSFKSYQYSYLRFLILWRFFIKNTLYLLQKCTFEIDEREDNPNTLFLVNRSNSHWTQTSYWENNEKILIYIISMHFSCALKQWGGGGLLKNLENCHTNK